MRLLPAVLAAAILSSPVLAHEEISIGVDAPVEETLALYDCAGERIEVRYINSGSVSLAVFDVDDELVVASNVISGSGARYVGGVYVWWSKGDEAMFENLMEDDDDPARCTLVTP